MNRRKMQDNDFNFPYLHGYNSETGEYRIMDSLTGACYMFTEGSFQDSWGDDLVAEGNRVVFRDDNDVDLYILDNTQLGWARLSDYLADLPEDIKYIQLVTEDWLCLQGGDTVYCYHIPTNLAMTPWTAVDVVSE